MFNSSEKKYNPIFLGRILRFDIIDFM